LKKSQNYFLKKKYQIFYYLNDETQRIDVDLPSEDTVEKAIHNILIKFNEKFKEEQMKFRFDVAKYEVFELFISSKNGKAKNSMPCKNLQFFGISSFFELFFNYLLKFSKQLTEVKCFQ